MVVIDTFFQFIGILSAFGVALSFVVLILAGIGGFIDWLAYQWDLWQERRSP